MRARALAIAEKPVEDLTDDEAALLTSEQYTLVLLSKEMGIPYEELLHRLWSSEITRYRAAHLVEMAQQDLLNAQHERKRKAEEQRNKNRIGRRL